MILSEIIQFVNIFYHINTFVFIIALVLVLLFFENMTNTNTIVTVGILFQYNTSRIVHLWSEPKCMPHFVSVTYSETL